MTLLKIYFLNQSITHNWQEFFVTKNPKKRFYIFSWFCGKRSTSCFMLNTVSWSICKVHSEGFFWTWIIYIQPSKSSIQHRQIKDKGRHSLCMFRYSHAMDPLEEVPQLLGLHLMAQSLHQAVADCHSSLCKIMNNEDFQSWSQNKIMIFKIFYSWRRPLLGPSPGLVESAY